MGRIDVSGAVGAHDGICLDVEASLDMDAIMGSRHAPSPRRLWYLPIKTVMEWVIALALVIVTAPLLVLLAAVVKMTSPGPAFYMQTRLGRYGRTYRIIKLRTMVQNAESGTGAVWAAKNDCRITAIGKLLRNTHLDEVPQLWNVLRGEMSLIGPRPERPEIARRIERQVSEFRHRLMVRPGITGLAQMRLPADDPNDVAFNCVRKKLSHDLYYIREVALLLDLRIGFSTVCYFLAAGIDAVRHALLHSHGVSAEGVLVEEIEEECERVA